MHGLTKLLIFHHVFPYINTLMCKKLKFIHAISLSAYFNTLVYYANLMLWNALFNVISLNNSCLFCPSLIHFFIQSILFPFFIFESWKQLFLLKISLNHACISTLINWFF